MAKWADFLISGVKFNDLRTHIESLEVREDLGETVGSPNMIARLKVVENIEKGITYMTIFRNSTTNKWDAGQEVRIIVVDNQKYLRTDRDKTPKDNLDNLPER